MQNAAISRSYQLVLNPKGGEMHDFPPGVAAETQLERGRFNLAQQSTYIYVIVTIAPKD